MVESAMRMGNEGVATDETGGLISASKVNGTNVYNTEGDSLGSIYDVMIDKLSGQVAYAVMSFGGFLGIGEDYSPLPWSALKYVVNIDKQALQGGPRYADSDYDRWEDPEFTRGIDDYYSRYLVLGGRAL
jgi:sporulation protein YlmC with PRC-barrel domain